MIWISFTALVFIAGQRGNAGALSEIRVFVNFEPSGAKGGRLCGTKERRCSGDVS
jgi:hypothetical protein